MSILLVWSRFIPPVRHWNDFSSVDKEGTLLCGWVSLCVDCRGRWTNDWRDLSGACAVSVGADLSCSTAEVHQYFHKCGILASVQPYVLKIYYPSLWKYGITRIISKAGQLLRHWERLPREVVESRSLEVLKRCVSVALQHMVYWWAMMWC